MLFLSSVSIAQSDKDRKVEALNILDQHEYLTKEITRLEYLQLEMSDYIQSQAFLVSELYSEVDLQQQLVKQVTLERDSLVLENTEISLDLFKYKKRAKKRFWIITSLAGGIITYAILK